MADSLHDPWIVQYLTDIAEEYGANLSSAPRKEKAVKAQLVKVCGDLIAGVARSVHNCTETYSRG